MIRAQDSNKKSPITDRVLLCNAGRTIHNRDDSEAVSPSMLYQDTLLEKKIEIAN
jgi:hypothetical protein